MGTILGFQISDTTCLILKGKDARSLQRKWPLQKFPAKPMGPLTLNNFSTEGSPR